MRYLLVTETEQFIVETADIQDYALREGYKGILLNLDTLETRVDSPVVNPSQRHPGQKFKLTVKGDVKAYICTVIDKDLYYNHTSCAVIRFKNINCKLYDVTLLPV
jgi:hypothetical protein